VSTNEPVAPEPGQKPEQDPDATMMVPTPGGRRAPPRPSETAARVAPERPEPAVAQPPAASLPGSGLNPLVLAANPLLALVVPLRSTAQPPDLQQLRERLVLAVKTFEDGARAAQIPVETIAAARYVLCTLLDETIAGTAWGSGVWGTRSLLVAFHNEASGGEKVFLILQRLSQDPRANLDLLELMYLCLSLGLEGRYRLIERGQEQLASLRERLLQLIKQQRGEFDADLSPQWRGELVAPVSSLQRIPLWVMAAGACVLLLAVQLVCSVLLNRASDPVFAGLSKIRVAQAASVAVPAPAPAPAVPSRIAGFLAPEIAQGLVSVRETAERLSITLRGDGMFGAGSAEVASQFAPLLARIGDALQAQPGKVIVTGHTDNTKPALSARFPSNYDLSKARAAGVMAMLAARAGPAARYSFDGRGDTEPQAANDTPVNRARNRRVDIVVLAPVVAP
jgi:type VI secretion system protein ImpK